MLNVFPTGNFVILERNPDIIVLFVCLFVCLMVFNATFNNISARGGQFYWWRKPEDSEKTIDLSLWM
jgi:hypothetical protein